MITRPCAVCGIIIQREEFNDRFCGPSCESLHADRQASRARGARPGDADYYPENAVQRNLHRTARAQKLRNTQ